jgi:hypothetical protein
MAESHIPNPLKCQLNKLSAFDKMKKTQINTAFFRHGLTRIYTVFTLVIPAQAGIQLFPFFSVVSACPGEAQRRGVSSVAKTSVAKPL